MLTDIIGEEFSLPNRMYEMNINFDKSPIPISYKGSESVFPDIKPI